MVPFLGSLLRFVLQASGSEGDTLSGNAVLRKPDQFRGIQQQIPKPSETERTKGPFRKSAVLGGLHHHYFRRAA